VLQPILNLFKQTLHPASALTILLLLATGTLLLYVGGGRWGRRWLTAVVLAYWFMATPACASWFVRPLVRGYGPLQSAAAAKGAAVIVLLSGGTLTYVVSGRSVTTLSDQSAFRALEAARLYRLLGRATIIASGGMPLPESQTEPEDVALRDALIRLGVAASDIVLESESNTTYEQAVRIKPMLTAMHVDRFVLVSSPEHMRRSLAVFEAQGLHPIPSVSARSSDFDRANAFVPARHALSESDAALYQYGALLYYWAHGRLSASH